MNSKLQEFISRAYYSLVAAKYPCTMRLLSVFIDTRPQTLIDDTIILERWN